jgi:hypothetical protein
LREDTDDSSVEHARTEELKVGGILSFGLDLNPLSDFLKLANNEGTVGITMAMSECKYSAGLLPTVL